MTARGFLLAALLVAPGALASGATAQPVMAQAEQAPAGVRVVDLEWVVERDSTVHLREDWIAADKALHLGGSFVLPLAGQYVLVDKAEWSNGRALPFTAGSTLALGLLKEVLDGRRQRNPHFSWRDLAADAAGVALAVVVVTR